jgi:hypothetical protein
LQAENEGLRAQLDMMRVDLEDKERIHLLKNAELEDYKRKDE